MYIINIITGFHFLGSNPIHTDLRGSNTELNEIYSRADVHQILLRVAVKKSEGRWEPKDKARLLYEQESSYAGDKELNIWRVNLAFLYNLSAQLLCNCEFQFTEQS